jgi:light-regulated signal transduction histidine kinase (bacteriophytochrome)
LKIDIADDLNAQADSTLVRVILENLLGNAWKYSSENSAAHIEVGSDVADGCTVYFVRDNGIGFDEAYSHKLFRPFERLHSDRRFDGAGIGLATVARAVQRMGGNVWAKSAPGEGATFFFTLERCHNGLG